MGWQEHVIFRITQDGKNETQADQNSQNSFWSGTCVGLLLYSKMCKVKTGKTSTDMRKVSNNRVETPGAHKSRAMQTIPHHQLFLSSYLITCWSTDGVIGKAMSLILLEVDTDVQFEDWKTSRAVPKHWHSRMCPYEILIPLGGYFLESLQVAGLAAAAAICFSLRALIVLCGNVLVSQTVYPEVLWNNHLKPKATLHWSLRALFPWYTYYVIGWEARDGHITLDLDCLRAQRNPHGWKFYMASYMELSV